MSTDTVPGFIYVIRNDVYGPWVKVGRTSNIHRRMQDYRGGMPPVFASEWEILGLWRVPDTIRVEEAVLEKLYGLRLPQSGNEWFKVRARLSFVKHVETTVLHNGGVEI